MLRSAAAHLKNYPLQKSKLRLINSKHLKSASFYNNVRVRHSKLIKLGNVVKWLEEKFQTIRLYTTSRVLKSP